MTNLSQPTYSIANPDSQQFTQFGHTVALSGDGSTLAIAARRADDEQYGAVFVYTRQGTQPFQLKSRLEPDTGATSEEDPYEAYLFGEAVAVSADGHTIVVGAPYAAPSDNQAAYYGAVFIFEQKVDDGTEWTCYRLTDDDPDINQEFGAAVAIDKQLIAIGAPGKYSNTGAAYYLSEVGKLGGDQLVELSYAGHAGGRFGAAVAVSRYETVVVGAPGTAEETGAIYVFFDPFHMGFKGPIRPAKTGAVNFGSSLALSANTLAVAGQGCVYVLEETQSGEWLAPTLLPLPDPTVKSLGKTLAVGQGMVIAGSDNEGVYQSENKQGGDGGWGKLTQIPAVGGNSVAACGWTIVVGNEEQDSVSIKTLNGLATVLDGQEFQFNSPCAIAIAGTYAYVANQHGNSITVLDLANPANPTLASVLDMDSQDFPTQADWLPYYAIAIADGYAYVTNFRGHSVTVLDLAKPAKPKLATVLEGNDFPFSLPSAIAIAGSYAYVANSGDGPRVTVLDLAKPAKPKLATVLEGNDFPFDPPWAIAIAGSYAYVGNYRNSVTVLDLANPAKPKLATVLEGNDLQFNGPWAIAIAGSYAYVANFHGDSITVLDLAKPANPTYANVVKGSEFQFNRPRAIAIAGSYAYAYVANFHGDSITVLDLAKPANPTPATVLQDFQFHRPAAIASADNYVYVANQHGNSVTVIEMKKVS